MWYRTGKDSEDYKRYISNICYRFGFQVIEENDHLYKVVNGVKTLLTGNEKPHERW
jgi:hypothetical protein